MSVLTAARSGIARAGATRSGYPVAQGVVLPKYALSGVARSGATRSGYHDSRVYVSIGGTQYATGRSDTSKYILYDEPFEIAEYVNHTPNTAHFTVKGFIPTTGQDVIVTLGSMNNLERQFGGQILSTGQSYVGTPANYQTVISAIDYTWGLNKRKVTGRFTTTTVSAVATAILAYTSGYTLVVDADIASEVIDEISFTEQDPTDCLTQLVKAVGGDWRCDYSKVIRLFFEDSSATNPTLLNAVTPTFLGDVDGAPFAVSRDLSQVITRVYYEGGGGAALEAVAVGETIIPLSTAAWYASSGTVASGPQRITYTSVDLGGAGSLVGPGAAPVSAPVAALASGTGIESGAHDYAVTFVTGSGESIASPHASITVGTVSAPSSAPTAGTPTIGTGPDAGSHIYAVTFVTSAGETTAGPTVTKATDVTAAPSTAPTVGSPTAGAGPDDGAHDYAVTFLTSIGETTPSPVSSQVTTRTVAAPTSASIANSASGASSTTNWSPGDSVYIVVTYITAAGETTGFQSNTVTATAANDGHARLLDLTLPVPTDAAVTQKRYYRFVNGVSQGYAVEANATVSDTDGGLLTAGSPPVSSTAQVQVVPLTAIPLGDANVTSRKLYRRSGGAGLKLLATIADNTTTTYTDTTANASLGAAVPSSSTAYLQRIPLSSIPTGSSLVTSRKIYRTVAGGSQLKLAHTLADNTTTTWTDTVTDASLGANVPVSNTAAANQVSLTAIPLGAATVTSRKVYRTVAGGSQLKLLTTIGDNTTTTYTDSTADGSLGVNVPGSDTSGLTQPNGNVLAGQTTLISAGVGWANASGGWAVIGNGQQVIRYTGISGNTLTGIPATGTGAITATVTYNSTITAAPCLRGVPASGDGSVQYAIVKGDPVNLFAQVDDTTAQAALAALIGGDGIQEAYFSDGRLSYTEAVARATAQLDLLKDALVTITYKSRDLNAHAGRTVSVNLGSPTSVSGDFLLQKVTITGFQPAIFPTREVEAASVRFSFEELLRMVRNAVTNA